MNNITTVIVTFLLVIACQQSTAQEVNLDDVNRLFDFAEQTYPELFSPAGIATDDSIIDWLHRYYPDTDSYAAVYAGEAEQDLTNNGVYAQGGAFGAQITYLGDLSVLVMLVDLGIPVNNVGGITNPGIDNCVPVVVPAAGTTWTTQDTRFGDNGSETVSTTDYAALAVSSINRQLRFDETQTLMGGSTISAKNEGDEYYVIEDNLRFFTRLSTDQMLENGDSRSGTTTFRPPQLVGPAVQYCQDQEWVIRPASFVTDVIPGENSIFQAQQVAGLSPERFVLVSAVDEEITVPAGTFITVKTTSDRPDNSTRRITWIDVETGIQVRSEEIDVTDESITRTILAMSIGQ